MGKALLLLRISINITSDPTQPQPSTWTLREHSDLLTAKVTSTSTQKSEPARRELGSLGKEHDQWSDAGSNAESQTPKRGWVLHKRKCIQYTNTLLGHDVDFHLLLPEYKLVIDLLWSQFESLPCINPFITFELYIYICIHIYIHIYIYNPFILWVSEITSSEKPSLVTFLWYPTIPLYPSLCFLHGIYHLVKGLHH